MKFLIIFVLLLVVLALIAMRYRKQIQTALYVWRMFRKMRQFDKPQEKRIETAETPANAALVRCVGCGNWVAETNVLKMGNKISYCSAACIEKSVNKA
ncbi:MAG TPA: hypothetical protein VF556_13500 [Pyrinomonadaceae bacterium]|jgi:Sec-independent protein translocase protein TatA